jgi:hypothetical protein
MPTTRRRRGIERRGAHLNIPTRSARLFIRQLQNKTNCEVTITRTSKVLDRGQTGVTTFAKCSTEFDYR